MFEKSFKTTMSMNNVVGGISGEYFNFFCEKCGSRLKVRFLGYESTSPKFEAFCKCGEIHQFRAIISDIPDKKIEQKQPNP